MEVIALKRYPIRDFRSGNKTKPRLFDLIIHDDGKKEIELKGKDGVRSVSLDDIRSQIKEIELHK